MSKEIKKRNTNLGDTSEDLGQDLPDTGLEETPESVPTTPIQPPTSIPTTPLQPATPIPDANVRVGEEVNGTHCKVYLVKDMKIDEFNHGIQGTLIAGQTDASLTRQKEVREIFHKDCNGNAKKSGGKNSWSLSLSGMVIFGDEGLELVEEIYDGDGSCGVYIEMGTRRYYGKAILVQNDMALPNDSEVTYDINVEGSGKLMKLDRGVIPKFSLPGRA